MGHMPKNAGANPTYAPNIPQAFSRLNGNPKQSMGKPAQGESVRRISIGGENRDVT